MSGTKKKRLGKAKVTVSKPKVDIIQQLSELCILSDCFLYEGRVYEKCDGPSGLYPVKPKQSLYRFMWSSDDYDYVEDKKLIHKLDKFLRGK